MRLVADFAGLQAIKFLKGLVAASGERDLSEDFKKS